MGEERLVVLTVNGEPVYAENLPQNPLDEAALEELAFRVTGDWSVAAAWMTRPNLDLGNRTPQQAVRDGDGHLAANILRGFMTL